MASPLDALQTRIGPAPAWVWLLGGGLVLYLAPKLGLFGPRASAIRAPGAPAGLVPPGFVPAGSTPAQAAAPTPSGDTPLNASDWQRSGSGYVYAPGGNQGAAFQRAGQVFFHLLDQGAVNAYVSKGGTVYYFPTPGQPVATTYGQASPGTAAYGVGPASGSIGTASGGARAPVSRAPGRRSEAPWHWHGHPLIKAQAHYPHYVAPGRGGASVHAVAHSAGLHPARVMAANPHLHGPGRGGPDDPGVGGFTDAMAQPSYTPPRTSRGPAVGIAEQDIGLQYMREPGAPLPASGGPRLPPHHVARAGQLIRVR